MTGNTATPPPEGLQPIGPYIRAAAQAVAFLRRNPREQAGTGPLPEWLDQASGGLHPGRTAKPPLPLRSPRLRNLPVGVAAERGGHPGGANPPVQPRPPPVALLMRRPYDPKPAPGAAPDPALLQAVALLSFYGAVADQFRRQNPDLQLAFIPAVTSSTGPGKRPHPKLGDWTGGQGLPFDRRLWNDPAVNGYGIVLSGSPDILVVDVDKAEALNPQAAALLEAWPGLTYKLRLTDATILCHHPGPADDFGQNVRAGLAERETLRSPNRLGRQKVPRTRQLPDTPEAPAWITELLTELEAVTPTGYGNKQADKTDNPLRVTTRKSSKSSGTNAQPGMELPRHQNLHTKHTRIRGRPDPLPGR